jgi:hypothetical protein
MLLANTSKAMLAPAPEQVGHVAGGDPRKRGDGNTGGHLADHGNPALPAGDGHERGGRRDREEDARNPRCPPQQRDHDDEGRHADEQRPRVHRRETGHHLGKLLPPVLARRRDGEDLAELAGTDHDGRARQVSGQHGCGQQPRRDGQPEERAQQQEPRHDEGEERGE